MFGFSSQRNWEGFFHGLLQGEVSKPTVIRKSVSVTKIKVYSQRCTTVMHLSGMTLVLYLLVSW